MEKLENMCLACARAIEYIHSKKCIHRCIAARSVLYTEEKLAKLCEFGLARTGDAYILKKSLRVPLKWTAPESLAACLYTTKLDVFSFSILLFEVFTEGKEPYKGMSSAEVKRMVACGSRMDKPKRCPDEIYALMKSCWEQNPDDRCTMTDVSLWTRDSLRDDVNLRIGQILKAKLGIPDAEPIRYEVHKDSSVRTSSMVKPRIVIPMKETRDKRI